MSREPIFISNRKQGNAAQGELALKQSSVESPCPLLVTIKEQLLAEMPLRTTQSIHGRPFKSNTERPSEDFILAPSVEGVAVYLPTVGDN
jgi:hypothetical protein